MADRVSVTIRISGTVAAAERDTLVQIVNDEALSIEWDGPEFDDTQFPSGAALRLHAHEVGWGKLDDLEAFCIERALPFVRWSGGYVGAFGPEIEVFTGAGDPKTFAADEEEQPVMCRATAARLGDFAAIMAYFDAADFVVPPLVVGP